MHCISNTLYNTVICFDIGRDDFRKLYSCKDTKSIYQS